MNGFRPRWRWWLFCAANEIDIRTGWRWARRLWAWAIPADAFGEAVAYEAYEEGDPF